MTNVNQYPQSNWPSVLKFSIWPICLVLCVVLFKEPISNILNNTAFVISNSEQSADIEINQHGLKFTKQIVKNAKDEVSEINQKLALLEQKLEVGTVNSTQIKKNIASIRNEATNLQKNIDKDLQIIQPPIKASSSHVDANKKASLQVVSSKNAFQSLDEVSRLETDGFKALLNKDFTKALSYFTQAEATKPGYHSVYEIKRFLSSKAKSDKDNNEFWRDIYSTIVNNYSWGMPKELKNEMKALI